RDWSVTGVQTCALPISMSRRHDFEDDQPYVVIEKQSGGGGLGSFVVGLAIGAGLALLFAPQSGEATRRDLRRRARRAKRAARERSEERRVGEECRAGEE